MHRSRQQWLTLPPVMPRLRVRGLEMISGSDTFLPWMAVSNTPCKAHELSQSSLLLMPGLSSTAVHCRQPIDAKSKWIHKVGCVARATALFAVPTEQPQARVSARLQLGHADRCSPGRSGLARQSAAPRGRSSSPATASSDWYDQAGGNPAYQSSRCSVNQEGRGIVELKFVRAASDLRQQRMVCENRNRLAREVRHQRRH